LKACNMIDNWTLEYLKACIMIALCPPHPSISSPLWPYPHAHLPVSVSPPQQDTGEKCRQASRFRYLNTSRQARVTVRKRQSFRLGNFAQVQKMSPGWEFVIVSDEFPGHLPLTSKTLSEQIPWPAWVSWWAVVRVSDRHWVHLQRVL